MLCRSNSLRKKQAADDLRSRKRSVYCNLPNILFCINRAPPSHLLTPHPPPITPPRLQVHGFFMGSYIYIYIDIYLGVLGRVCMICGVQGSWGCLGLEKHNASLSNPMTSPSNARKTALRIVGHHAGGCVATSGIRFLLKCT